MKVPSIRGSRLLVVVIAPMLAQVALAQGISGHWGSSLYEVQLFVAGETVSGTFTPLLDSDGAPGTISGRLQDGGGGFQAEWTRPMGAGHGSFNTLLALDTEGRVLTGYRWDEGFDPTSFAMHRAVDGEIPRLVDVGEAGEPPLADNPLVPPAPAPVWGQVVVCRSVEVCRSMVDGQPVGAGTTDHFDHTDTVVAVIDHKNIPRGSNAVAIWTCDGEEFGRGEKVIGGNGSASFGIRTRGGVDMEPGLYTVTITVGETVLGRKSFTIGTRQEEIDPPQPIPARAPGLTQTGGSLPDLSGEWMINANNFRSTLTLEPVGGDPRPDRRAGANSDTARSVDESGGARGAGPATGRRDHRGRRGRAFAAAVRL